MGPIAVPSMRRVAVTFDDFQVGAHDQRILQPFDTPCVIHGGRRSVDRCWLPGLRGGLRPHQSAAAHNRGHQHAILPSSGFTLPCVGRRHDAGAGRANVARICSASRIPSCSGKKEVRHHDRRLRHLEGRQMQEYAGVEAEVTECPIAFACSILRGLGLGTAQGNCGRGARGSTCPSVIPDD